MGGFRQLHTYVWGRGCCVWVHPSASQCTCKIFISRSPANIFNPTHVGKTIGVQILGLIERSPVYMTGRRSTPPVLPNENKRAKTKPSENSRQSNRPHALQTDVNNKFDLPCRRQIRSSRMQFNRNK